MSHQVEVPQKTNLAPRKILHRFQEETSLSTIIVSCFLLVFGKDRNFAFYREASKKQWTGNV